MTQFSWEFPYASRRVPIMARNIVATSQPLAAQAGLRMLQKGGNAVDAAIVAAIALTVVEPTMNGIGGDAFAIVWDGNELHGLNASGRSPAVWDFEQFSQFKSVPVLGWNSVTIPGAVSSWVELSDRFGRSPFEDLFEPAIEYAYNGFLVSPITAERWSSAPKTYKDFPEFAAAFLPNGRAPKVGEKFEFKAQAKTLERIAGTKGEAFYHGDLADKIVAHAKATGGLITKEDLAAHKADWVETISINYHGFTLCEIPPNGQGIAALLMLGILEHRDIQDYPVDSADSLHLQIEAMKLAFADTYRYVSDPSSMDIDYKDLLNSDYLSQRAKLIDLAKAQNPGYGIPERGDTVYLTTADANGMIVSFIQSNYLDFGSGIVVPDTGISLQSRAACFSLERGHPNQVEGGKRPFHTIIPAFVTKDDQPLMSFGVMGGAMQPQGQAQIMIRMFDYHQNPQAACDAPRWQVFSNMEVAFESGFKPEVLEDLSKRGHKIKKVGKDWGFGGAQLIYKLADGYCGASDPRKDGQAVGF
ncbi:MAG: gamma-glutamyltransferase [Chloroflexi bacterium CG07_land_8_20_14_0_80_45_17]|nr:MAG: gamma-glutamyltransferase [Chloroflexi bacterium CG07_land_8_20_14_0_80_45_17]